jgi:hypothetical protein
MPVVARPESCHQGVLVAFVLDVDYQVIVFRWVYPFEALAVSIILAFLPYLLLRGLVNRIARIRVHPKIAQPC